MYIHSFSNNQINIQLTFAIRSIGQCQGISSRQKSLKLIWSSKRLWDQISSSTFDFFPTFFLTCHFLPVLFSRIPDISLFCSCSDLHNSEVKLFDKTNDHFATLLWPLQVATRKSCSLCLWESLENESIYDLFLGVSLGITLPPLQICSDLALEVHTSQTEDSSPCWPHSVSTTAFSSSQNCVILFWQCWKSGQVSFFCNPER